MGLIVHDTYHLANGLTVSDYYIKIHEISFIKNPQDATKYIVKSTYDYYASKEARDNNKEKFTQYEIITYVTSLENLQSAVYTEIKKLFTNCSDDI